MLKLLCLLWICARGVQVLVADLNDNASNGDESLAMVNASNLVCDGTSNELVAMAWLDKALLDSSNVLRNLSDQCAEKFELRARQTDASDFASLRNTLGSYDVSKCSKTLLPSVVYLGQGHSGSTVLASQLDAHPELSFGDLKEHHWGDMVFSGNGYLREYTEQFRVPCGTKVSMDFSAGIYLSGYKGRVWERWEKKEKKLGHLARDYNFSAAVEPEILRDILGEETKLIVMLRDPVDLLDSLPHWWTKRMLQVDGDCYAVGVERWLSVFPRRNVLFLKSEDYWADSQGVLSQIFDFLDVTPWEYPGKAQDFGRRRMAHTISSDERRAYHASEHHADCRRRLENLTGLTFRWPGVA